MKNGLLLRNCYANCGCDLFICRLANFIDLTLSRVEISEVDTKMETKNCNYDWNVCSEVDAQLVENRKVDGVENLVGSKTENEVVLTKDGMAEDVELRRSQCDVRGFSSDGVWFGDVDGLEEWLSEVMMNEDKNPIETETLIMELPNLSNSPPPPPSPPPSPPPPPPYLPTQFGERMMMGDPSMEATSVLPITPVMNGDAKKAWMEMSCARVSPMSSDDDQAPDCRCMRIGMDYDICGLCREMENKQYERSEKDSVS